MPVAKVATQEELKQIVRKHLHSLASEADVDALRSHEDIGETLEVDSFDFTAFLAAVSVDTGVVIPEHDHDQVNTIDKLVRYLHTHASD